MGSANTTIRVFKGLAIVLVLTLLAACARTANTGVGNLGPGAAGPGTQQEFLVTVGDRVFFDTDSSVLNETSRRVLDNQAVWLNKYSKFNLLIEGHADERGTREYNIALGERRANSVVNYLISRGISANRIASKSFGKQRPVAVCDDISCWSQNRRAVTVLVGN
jgi:peptidoglycan-associated lipoprotein